MGKIHTATFIERKQRNLRKEITEVRQSFQDTKKKLNACPLVNVPKYARMLANKGARLASLVREFNKYNHDGWLAYVREEIEEIAKQFTTKDCTEELEFTLPDNSSVIVKVNFEPDCKYVHATRDTEPHYEGSVEWSARVVSRELFGEEINHEECWGGDFLEPLISGRTEI